MASYSCVTTHSLIRVRNLLATQGTDKTEFAIKVIIKDQLSPEDKIGLEQEIEIMMEIQHPHVIRLYEAYNDEWNPVNVYLVTELVRSPVHLTMLC